MGYFSIVFKISCIIALLALTFNYSTFNNYLIHAVHTITPVWLYTHKPKTSDANIPKTSDTNIAMYNIISNEGDRLFSKEELSQFVGDGSTNSIYIAILGRVYDVTSGKEFYSTGSGYGFFAGKDGTRAFMSGDFTPKGLIEDTTGLTSAQMIELENWIKFYDGKYIYKGKLHGLYYNEHGHPTPALFKVRDNILAAQKEKLAEDKEKQRFPMCNHEWGQKKFTRVWCTDKSGGISRDWVGVPRKYFPPGAQQENCVCVRTIGPPSDNPTSSSNVGDLNNPHLRLYKGCDVAASSCDIIE